MHNLLEWTTTTFSPLECVLEGHRLWSIIKFGTFEGTVSWNGILTASQPEWELVSILQLFCCIKKKRFSQPPISSASYCHGSFLGTPLRLFFWPYPPIFIFEITSCHIFYSPFFWFIDTVRAALRGSRCCFGACVQDLAQMRWIQDKLCLLDSKAGQCPHIAA